MQKFPAFKQKYPNHWIICEGNEVFFMWTNAKICYLFILVFDKINNFPLLYAINTDFMITRRIDVFVGVDDSSPCKDRFAGICSFDGSHKVMKMLNNGLSIFICERFFWNFWLVANFRCFINLFGFPFHRSTMRNIINIIYKSKRWKIIFDFFLRKK